jgi:hypothetical protein
MYVKDIVIDLVNPPISWEKFSLLGNNKIALDGYVSGGPKKDLRFKIFNFNHHEDVPRLETRATCAQVLIAIRQGITELFSADVDNSVTVYVNDCDEDVCLSVFLLRYPHLVRNTINPAINRLVHIEDMLDTTAGAYPLPDDLPFLEDLAWIYAPYRSARRLGVLGLRDVDAYREVIETVGERIKLYILGNGSKIKLDTSWRFRWIYS